MDTAVIVLRSVLSLTAVLGLIWYAGRKLNDSANGQGGDGFLARLVSGAGGTRRTGRRGQPAVTVTVVARQVLGAKASLAVVDVGDQRLVLGVTEGGVNVLSTQTIPAVEELADELVKGKPEIREEIALAPVPASVRTKPTLVPDPAPEATVLALARPAGPLDSSILSPTTWRQTLSLMQGRTVRR